MFEKKVGGGPYTRVRLDRAVADPSWFSLFPMASVMHVTAACSDHTPIWLQFSKDLKTKKGAKPFKYELMWETHPKLKTFVENGWKDQPASTTAFSFRRN